MISAVVCTDDGVGAVRPLTPRTAISEDQREGGG